MLYILGLRIPVVIVAVAGRSNGLGPVIAGYTNLPVINCPPLNATNVNMDIWSSLNVPSGNNCFNLYTLFVPCTFVILFF